MVLGTLIRWGPTAISPLYHGNGKGNILLVEEEDQKISYKAKNIDGTHALG